MTSVNFGGTLAADGCSMQHPVHRKVVDYHINVKWLLPSYLQSASHWVGITPFSDVLGAAQNTCLLQASRRSQHWSFWLRNTWTSHFVVMSYPQENYPSFSSASSPPSVGCDYNGEGHAMGLLLSASHWFGITPLVDVLGAALNTCMFQALHIYIYIIYIYIYI